MIDRGEILRAAVKGAYNAALVGGATSVCTGFAMTTTPVTVLGVITVGTTTAVSLPIMATCAGVAAAAAGATSAYRCYRAQRETEDLYADYMGGSEGDECG